MTTLYFEQQANVISVRMRTDVSVNAWKGTIEMADTRAIARVAENDTPGTLWQTAPTIELGKGIVFAGGIPNGFIGDRELFSFTLQDTPLVLRFSSDAAAYLNDGKGTEVAPVMAVYVPDARVVTRASPMPADTVPPEPFTPIIYSDSAFGELPVAVFGAYDAGTGISKYEVQEFTAQGAGSWISAKSPYAVNPGVVKLAIRAYDNAGNIRTEELLAAQNTSAYMPYAAWGGAILAVLLVGYTIKRRWRRKYK